MTAAGLVQALTRRAAVTVTVAFCLISIAVLLTAFFKVGAFGLDYRVFRYSTQVSLADIYAPHPHAPFVYPPTAIALFRPLGLMPISVGLAIWTSVSALLFLFATRGIDRRALLLVVISPVFVKCLLMGQVALILTALILLGTSRRGWIAGALLGLVIAIKPQMVILAPVALAVRRDWRACGAMVVSVALVLLLELALYGFHPWLDWWQAMPAFRQVLVDDNLLRLLVNPSGVAQYLGLPAIPFLAMGILLGLAGIVKAAPRLEGPELGGLMVAASVLASPYALAHDALALLPIASAILIQEKFSIRTIAAMLVLTMQFMAIGLMLFALQWSWKARAGERHPP